MDVQLTFEDISPAYAEFVEKFKPKKTTDDCYTPPIVYEAIADWVAAEYDISKERFVRPFYPGGNYQRFDYSEGSVVVDNPPFSLLSQIVRFYCAYGVRFFLFAPTLTLFTANECDVCYMPLGVSIFYDNGAKVNTSFITNLDEDRIRVVPALYQAIDSANKANQKAVKNIKPLPKYDYPDEVITAAMASRWCKYGIEFRLSRREAIYIGTLDSQRASGKSIFGGGYLISERAAAERWELSPRERAIVRELGRIGE